MSILLPLLLLVAQNPESPVSDALRNDARLADVAFVDPQQGWAVGDRGAIWHTDDGGRRWQLQESGVACPLESVCFLDPQTGWAAGGTTHPYTHTGSGLLLATRDGGKHWQCDPHLLLPPLKKVRFFDPKRGWAIGAPSAMYPTGAFTTDTGGRSWTPLGGGNLGAWLAGDLLDPRTGAVAGRGGVAAVVQQGNLQPARTGSFGLRNLAQLRLVPPTYGWLVGDGGLVMLTGDLGITWQTTPGELPPGTAQHFDFAALAVRGPKCWIAGTPGTRVFHTADAGHTWIAYGTGSPVPVQALCFVDDDHGWAVGALGTILATADGGRTWQRQHAGGTRAALLGLFTRADDVPLELLARLAGDEGYLASAEVLNRRDVEAPTRDRVPLADRLHEALVGVGASDSSVAWQFPLRQDGLQLPARQIIDGWDRANDGRGMQELEAHLIRQIRVWRPDVVLTCDSGPRGEDPLAKLINQAVLQAVARAGDASALPQQLTEAGLEPWQVKRVFAATPSSGRSPIELTTAQLAPRLGRSLADAAAGPRGLIEERFSAPPATLGFCPLVDNVPSEQGRRDFFTGILLPPGGEARRLLAEPAAERLDMLRQLAQQRRNTQAILEQAEQDPQGGANLLAQTGQLIRRLDADNAARMLYHLAQRYYRTGQWALAAETMELLTQRYPDHPLSRPAAIWLVQYYASSETAWRVHGGQRTSGAAYRVEEGRRLVVASGSMPAIDVAKQEDRPARAAALGKEIERTRPELFAEPALRFPLAAAHRQQGFPRQSERYYQSQARSPNRDAWWACAQGELWLAEPKGLSPKPLLMCVPAAAKPRLDGRLDDPVWRQAKSVALQSAQHDDADWPAAVMLAYDKEFLYIAVHCRHAPGVKYAPAPGPRPRDADLSAHDRVDIFLDLDRDYATYYRLTIDHRGWTGDSCWGDAAWNPTWFVAAAAGDDAWTAEAAIPFEQLTGRAPAARDVWAVGVQRTVPGVGFQSWTAPAATAVVPEGFGYLIFE